MTALEGAAGVVVAPAGWDPDAVLEQLARLDSAARAGALERDDAVRRAAVLEEELAEERRAHAVALAESRVARARIGAYERRLPEVEDDLRATRKQLAHVREQARVLAGLLRDAQQQHAVAVPSRRRGFLRRAGRRQ